MKNLAKFSVFALLLLTFIVVYRREKTLQQAEAAKPFSSLFAEVAELVKNDYVDAVDPRDKFPPAFASLFSALDPQSAYLDPLKNRLFMRFLQGDVLQTGIFVRLEGTRLQITQVKKKSPAAEAGLQPGDTIEAINHKSLLNQSYWGAYLTLLSDRPDSILLAVQKKNTESTTEVTLQLKSFPPAPVCEEIGGNTFILHLARIQAGTVQAIEKRFAGQKDLNFIVDLTQYEYGELESFLKLTRLFFPPDTSLTLKTKRSLLPLAVGSPSPLSFKAIVIIDESTQMYNELLAALFRKHRATLIGQPTSGVAVQVQRFSLENDSAVLLTTGHFLFAGTDMTKTRIAPDLEISAAESSRVHSLAAKLLKKPG